MKLSSGKNGLNGGLTRARCHCGCLLHQFLGSVVIGNKMGMQGTGIARNGR